MKAFSLLKEHAAAANASRRGAAAALCVAALKRGDFYASEGPELRGVRLAEHEVAVESSAVQTVIVQGHGAAATAVHGQSLTSATVPLDRVRNSPWLRVTVIDRAGRRAWSNPIWR